MQDLIAVYGEATIKLIQESHRFGHAIVDGFPDYLGCDKQQVKGVPPEGEVDLRRDYGDAIFSYHKKGLNFLEPIAMGLYVEFANKTGRGATWVLIGVEFWLRGSSMVVTIDAEPDKSVTLPLIENPDLTPVFERLYDAARSRFSIELDDARERSKLGFIEHRKD